MKHRKTFILVALFAVILTAYGFQTSPEYKILFEKAKFTMETKGDLTGAINLFNDIIKKYPKEREYAAKSQLYIGLCYEKLGVKEAQKAYQKVVNSYPEQTEAVKAARDKLSALQRAQALVEKDDNKSDQLLLSGVGSHGILSPDETQVAYVGLDSQLGDLLVKDLKTGIVKTVVQPQKRGIDGAQSLVWSPDGKQIVYGRPTKSLLEMRIVNIKSGESRVIWADSLTSCYPADWSTDGKSIVCIVWKTPDKSKVTTWTFGYGVYDIETRKLSHFISAEGLENGTASFSPDGKYIVYDLTEKGNRDIFAYSIATGEKTRLTDSPAKDGEAKWSRDGKYVLFNSYRRGSWDLWAVPIQNAKTSGEPFLVQSDFGNKSKTITRSGKLAYSVFIEMADVYTLDVNPMTGESTGDPKLITTSHYGSHGVPAWSPDGKKMAYLRRAEPNYILCIRTLENGLEEYYTGMQGIGWFSWSPDGKSMALSGQTRSYKRGVFLYSIETGQLSTIIENERPDLKGWSLNGKELFFVLTNEQKDRELVAIDINTKEKRVLEKSVNIWLASSMSLSPDCKRMAYIQTNSVTNEMRLVVSDLKDQEKRVLVTVDQRKAWIKYPIWSPDGRMIEYFFADQ